MMTHAAATQYEHDDAVWPPTHHFMVAHMMTHAAATQYEHVALCGHRLIILWWLT